MKEIFSGLESSGKSLQLAMVAEEIVDRNAKWLNRTGVMRPIVSNLWFSDEFEKYALDKGIKIIYWEQLPEVIVFNNCDVFMDEVGNYFDSRGWENLTIEVRSWLSQCAKSGVEIYGTAQDFAQVDKAFRRLVNKLHFITKLIGSPRPANTKPPVKHIWGVCLVQELDPNSYNEDKKQFKSQLIPSFFFIRKHYCDMFDTTKKIPQAQIMPYRHEERQCLTCGYSHVMHR
jgi:hypothetical protein